MTRLKDILDKAEASLPSTHSPGQVTSFAYYYHRKHGKPPLPQEELDMMHRYGQTYSDMRHDSLEDYYETHPA